MKLIPVRALLLAGMLGLLALVVATVFAFAIPVAVASAETTMPWWHVNVSSRPSVWQPGHEGTVVVSATNLGGRSAGLWPGDGRLTASPAI